MRQPRSVLRRAPSCIAATFALLVAAAAAAQPTSIGLSTVRAQRFGNDNLSGFYTPQTTDLFAYTLAVGDFDGNGADDLATGMPYDNGLASSPVADSGSVVVRYSSPGSGLTTNPSQVYLRQQRNPPEPGDLFGWSLAACDFNADDFDDLAVGVPYEDYLGEENAGIVHVYYGGAGGLQPSGDTFFAQSTAGVPGDVEEWDRFGWSLACGDFDGDGFDDLVVGDPWETWGGWSPTCPPGGGDCALSMGMVVIVPGSANGLAYAAASHLDQDVDGVGGSAEDGDFFGSSLAAGDFDDDGLDDLAIGVPGEDDDRGLVHVAFGSPSGPRALGCIDFGESSVGGVAEEGDRFGETLAGGDFDGDGVDDLAIGIPYEDFAAANTGQVGVLYGAAGGFDQRRTQFWSEQSIFGEGTSEANDSFGYALAVGDFDEDGRDDLAIAHPAESVLGAQDGAVTFLMGASSGLSTARRRQVVAGIEGFPGDRNQHGKYFGFSVASGDFDGDGHGDLAIGSPWETQGGVTDVGAETVLYGALFADGVETGNTALWSQTVSSPYTTFNNVRVTAAARLGPAGSTLGLQLNLFNPTLQRPASATYVRVGPEAGFHDERTLGGQLFVDLQGLTMSSAAGANSFQMLVASDSLGAGSKGRLAFDVVRTATNYSIVANYWNDLTNSLQFAASGVIADAGDPNGHNVRIEFDWRAGDPGHLTMWRTRFVNGGPDPNGRVQLFSVDLPSQGTAIVNHLRTGMITGQDRGTYGSFFLDELSFHR